MSVVEKLSVKEQQLIRIFKNPVLFGEFLHEIDSNEGDLREEVTDIEQNMEFTIYQKELLVDTNPYISLRASRAVGKTFAIVHMIIWILFNNLYPGEYIIYSVPNKAQLDPVWEMLKMFFRTNSLLKNFVNYRSGINNSEHRIETKAHATLMCRIAGQSGKGENVIGLHTPFFIVDECIVGTQRIAGKNTNKRISELKVGDIVLSWDGKNVVEDRISSIKKIERKQKVLEIQYNDTYIRVGENHKIYTDRGYIPAKNLVLNDSVYLHKNTNRKYWSEEEITFVKEQIALSVEVADIALALDRTPQSIFRKLSELGLSVREIFDKEDLSKEEYQVILGSFLGDGSAEIELNRARYRTNHSLKQKEYVDWLVSKLGRLVRTGPRISKNGGWGTLNYSFGTLGHPQILELATELYPNNIKTVTREYLNKLSSLGLAVWWMDDGSDNGVLSTHSFSKKENEIIAEYLKEKWNISSKVSKDKDKDLYYIHIKHSSLKTLKRVIEKHIPDCMKYKIGEGKYNNSFPKIQVVKSAEIPETLYKFRVTKIKEVNTRAKYLYDITVEGNHNFFINGVLTKNSGYYPWGTWLELQATINYWMSGSKLIVSGVPTGIREENVNYHADKNDDTYSRYRIDSYQNPRFDDEAEADAIRRYGGKNTEEFAHFVLGQHGSPIYAVFDRRLMDIKSYPVYKIALNGITFGEKFNDYLQKVQILPAMPKNNGVIFGVDLGYCYSEDTDVLTKRGWISHKDITMKDIIACYDTKEDEITWDNPLWLWEQDYTGKMLEVEGKSTNFCVSPEHKIWAEKYIGSSPSGKYERLKAKDLPNLSNNRFKVKVAAKNKTQAGPSTFEVPYYYSDRKDREKKSTTVNMTDWVKFLAWFITEGSATNNTNWEVNITQSKDRYTDEIDELLKKLPYVVSRKEFETQWGKTQVSWRITCKELCIWLRNACGIHAKNKRIPDFIFETSTKDQEIFLQTLLKGDGSRLNGIRSPQYNSSSHELLDQVHRLAISLGYSSTKNFYEDSQMGRVSIVKKTENQLFRDTNVKEIDYSGKIYCLKSPTGYYVTRRKGKVAFQGNTEPTAIFIMYLDDDMRFRFHSKIRLVKVPYPIQKRFIDALDSKYSPSLIGMDEGHAGMSVIQDLLKGKQYQKKNYEDYLIPIKFNSAIILGVDEDGKEIKSRAKPLSVSLLQEYTNKHRIIYSTTDMDTITELERMSYTKNPTTGIISYRTMTPAGGHKGEDHFTASLLSAVLAYYLTNESLDFRSKQVKLLGTGWL